ncbi:MAG TPA: DNA primase [Candidatus Saccharimonadales bacterium]
MDAKEEVRSRLDIVDVIGEYVRLQRAGRSFKGLSPFTDEKTPSFFVSPEKQIWHCFSTNKGGDVFSFIMEVEGLDFKGALELLARKAGVDISQFQRGDGSLGKKKERLFGVLELSVRFFQQAMVQSKVAQDYIFKQRHLNKQTVQAFAIGYAPDANDSLTKLLLKRGYTEGELVDAGVSVRRQRGLGDLFRGRMMIPLRDPQGRTLGFTGRLIVENPRAPKYLNTPQTLLYDKSRHVFGLDLAKEAIRTNNCAVLVEGNVDVISSYQAGIAQVVATAGTALTEHHLATLKRFTPDIRLCFDADKAGIAATERSIPIAQTVGINLGIIQLPAEVKDPDQLLQAGVTKWQQAIMQPKDALEWVVDYYRASFGGETATQKATVSTKALQLIASVKDPVQIEHYTKYLAAALGVSEQALRTKFTQTAKQPDIKAPLKPTHTEQSSPDIYAYQDLFLALNLAFADVRGSLKHVSQDDFIGEQRRQMFGIISQLGDTAVTDSNLSRIKGLQIDETYGKILLFKAEERYDGLEWTGSGLYHEAVQLAHRIKNDTRTRTRKTLSSALKKAYEEGDDVRVTELSKQYQALMKEE